MSTRVRSLLLLGFWASSLVVACSRRPVGRSTSSGSAPDSLSGIIAVTGTDRSQQILIGFGSGAVILHASPTDSSALVRLGGVEVRVYGARSSQAMSVSRFRALTVEGKPVIDGLIVREGARISIATESGRVVLGNPPTAFSAMIGVRVWVGGPIDTGPNVYGVIAPAK